MLNQKENIVCFILGAFLLFAAIGISLIGKNVTGSTLVAMVLGISFLLKPIVYRKIYSETIDNAWLFYTNEDGDYKGECITIRDVDLKLLQEVLPAKAGLTINDGFKIYNVGMTVESKNKQVKIYFDENDFRLIKVSRFLFGAKLTEKNSELLKLTLKRYLN